MMMDKVKAYRKSRRKCVYCVHLERSGFGGYRKSTAYWCAAKMKFISLHFAWSRRPFCRCFEVEKSKGSTRSTTDG